MSRPLRVALESFWSGFDRQDNFFVRLIAQLGPMEIVDAAGDPDHLIYADYGRSHLRIAAQNRIYFSAENRGPPDYRECDWSFGSWYSNDPRHYRLPLYAMTVERLGGWREVERMRAESLTASPHEDREFCCMVVSNARAPERLELFTELGRHRRVASGGRLWNNVGGPVSDAAEFIRNFRFAIAYENSSSPGYTTEKLIRAYAAGAIPIYWGNPSLNNDFDTSALVNRHDYRSLDDMVAQVVHLDGDVEARGTVLKRSLRPDGALAEPVSTRALQERFRLVLEHPSSSRKCSSTWTFRSRQLRWQLSRLRKDIGRRIRGA